MQKNMVCKGNIVRNGVKSGVPLYLGSGDFGGCFDTTGAMMIPYSDGGHTNTVFMHADYWHRGKYGLDYHLPAFQLAWNQTPDPMIQNTQVLDMWNGTLQTAWEIPSGTMQITGGFHPYQRDLFAAEFTYSKKSDAFPFLVLQAVREIQVDYGTQLEGTMAPISQDPDLYVFKLSAGSAELVLQVRLETIQGNACLQWKNDRLEIHLSSETGKFRIYLAASSPLRQDTAFKQLERFKQEDFFRSSEEGWHRRWGTSDLFFDEKTIDTLFVRSVYYALCSYSPESNCVAPPTGWTANGWAFHFPQDFSYILPVFLKLGHFDIAKAKLEFYHRQLDVMKEYTKRVYGASGVMWAWIFPIGDASHILPDGAPNWFHYEIHNAAYPARMAYETAKCLKDDNWSRTVAWEMVQASADFYTSVLQKEGNTWGICVTPSMGQDEWGGHNAKNYLCALYAAKFTLKTAVRMAEELGIEADPRWKEILSDGLAFERLENHKLGIYQTCEGDEDDYQIGKMKHPIPLMPITFLPFEEELNAYEKHAWELRYRLCEKSEQTLFSGWTLEDLMLSDVRMNDRESFLNDFQKLLPSDSIDPEWIAIYESSKIRSAAYYVTNHCLLAQAVLDGAAHDYFGKLEKDSLKLNNLSFRKLYLRSGSSCDFES